jgi:hypothetical protein
MTEYTGSHRAPRDWGRWLPLVAYGLAFVGIAATLAGWWR